MELTDAAEKRLLKLMPKGCRAFEFKGAMGTCRGSTPILQPLKSDGAENLQRIDAGKITFYAAEDELERLQSSHLDYDGTPLFGKGLTMTWPHRNGCACTN